MNKKIQDAINKQINAELYSSYLYLSMAAYLDNLDLTGFAHWMKMQAQEEVEHAMKFYHYLFERGGTVKLDAIAKPSANFTSPLDIAKKTLAHEKKVTDLINKLYELGLKEKNYAFQSFLKWFIDEQVEEESSAITLIDKIKLAGREGPGLYLLDKELAGRGKND